MIFFTLENLSPMLFIIRLVCGCILGDKCNDVGVF